MTRLFQSTVLVLAALGISGCGGCGKRKERPVNLNVSEYEVEPAPAQAAPVVKPAAVTPAAPAEPEEPAAPIAPPPKPKRPEDLADWQDSDYQNAKAERDPRLPEAVRFFSASKPGDEQVVVFLVNLLDPVDVTGAIKGVRKVSVAEGEEEEAVNLPTSSGSRVGSLGEAIVVSLADNGSPPAVDALKQLLRGEFRSDLDRDALVRVTLQAMSERSRPDYADLILTVLTNPEEFRPAASGSSSAANLQRDCFAATSKTMSQQIRAALARHISVAGVPTSHRDLLLPYLLKPEVNNIEAQVILYARDAVGDVQQPVQAIWGELAPRVLERFLDISHERIALGEETNLSQMELMRAAQALWSEDCAKAVALQLADEQEDLLKHPQMATLAASMPSPAVRQALAGTINQHWVKWSHRFNDKSFDMRSVRDPGLLLVFCALPREADPNRWKKKGKANGDDGESAGEDRGGPEKKLDPAQRERLEKRYSRYAWQTVTEKLVQSMNERFHAAALLRSKATGKSSVPSADKIDLPVKLHPEAELNAYYALNWPADLGATVDSPVISPLNVRYARIETQDRFGKLFLHYKQQLGSPEDHLVPRGKRLELLRKNSETGLSQIIHVQVIRAADMPPTARESSESLIVEILSVEVPDPTAASPAVERVQSVDLSPRLPVAKQTTDAVGSDAVHQNREN